MVFSSDQLTVSACPRVPSPLLFSPGSTVDGEKESWTELRKSSPAVLCNVSPSRMSYSTNALPITRFCTSVLVISMAAATGVWNGRPLSGLDPAGYLPSADLTRMVGGGGRGIGAPPRRGALSLGAAEAQSTAEAQLPIHRPVEVEPERSARQVRPDDHAIVLEEAPGRVVPGARVAAREREIGRASCRERV